MKNIEYPQNFLTARFSIILGLFGFGKMWSLSEVLFLQKNSIGEFILLTTSFIWAIFIVVYAIKLAFNSEQFINELKHPINNNYVGLIGVSTMLIASILKEYSFSIALSLFIIGLIIQLSYGVYIKQSKWLNNHETNKITPSLYIPSVAGNFVTAVVAGYFGYQNLGYLFLGIGFFSWISLESIIMNRLYKLRLEDEYFNTLGIMMAPSAIAAMACLSLNLEKLNLIIILLIGYSIFHTLVFLRFFFILILKPFNLGYWACSFGFTTLTNVTIIYSKLNNIYFLKIISFILFTATNTILIYLITNSLKLNNLKIKRWNLKLKKY